MSGTFVLTATIQQTFDDLFADIYKRHRRGGARRRRCSRATSATGAATDDPRVASRRSCAARRRSRPPRATSRSTTRRSSTRTGKADRQSGPGRAHVRIRLGPDPAAEPVPHRRAAARRSDADEIVIDKAQRRQGQLHGRRHGRRCSPVDPPQQLQDRRHRAVRHGRQPRRRVDRAVHAAARRSASRTRPGSSTTSRSSAKPGLSARTRSQPTSRRRWAARPRQARGAHRRGDHQGEPGHDRQGSWASSTSGLLIFAFIALIVGVVHHLQHVLDRRRAAHARDGAAARDRRERAPGARLGASVSRIVGRRARVGLGVLGGIGARDRLLKACIDACRASTSRERVVVMPPQRGHHRRCVVGDRRHDLVSSIVPGLASGARSRRSRRMRDVAIERRSVKAPRGSVVGARARRSASLLLLVGLFGGVEHLGSSSASARCWSSSASSCSARCSRAGLELGARRADRADQGDDRHARSRERGAQPEAHGDHGGRADDRRRARRLHHDLRGLGQASIRDAIDAADQDRLHHQRRAAASAAPGSARSSTRAIARAAGDRSVDTGAIRTRAGSTSKSTSSSASTRRGAERHLRLRRRRRATRRPRRPTASRSRRQGRRATTGRSATPVPVTFVKTGTVPLHGRVHLQGATTFGELLHLAQDATRRTSREQLDFLDLRQAEARRFAPSRAAKAIEPLLKPYPTAKLQDNARVQGRPDEAGRTSCLNLIYVLLFLAVDHRVHRHRQHVDVVDPRTHA